MCTMKPEGKSSFPSMRGELTHRHWCLAIQLKMFNTGYPSVLYEIYTFMSLQKVYET